MTGPRERRRAPLRHLRPQPLQLRPAPPLQLNPVHLALLELQPSSYLARAWLSRRVKVRFHLVVEYNGQVYVHKDICLCRKEFGHGNLVWVGLTFAIHCNCEA